MDLGIAGKWALVCGASKGLGRGCAQALVQEGVNLVINGRQPEALAQAAALLAEQGEAAARARGQTMGFPLVLAVAADITTTHGRESALKAPGGPAAAFDIVVTNAGGPPTGDFREWGREAWLAAVEANMLTPIELIKATVDGMAARGFGRIVNITSSAVKAPIDVLGLSNGARSGLTGFVAGLARNPALAGRGVTINNLLPGRFATDRIESMLHSAAAKNGQTLEEARATMLQSIPAGRFGSTAEFGAFCAFVCSQHAGYLTGQNFLLDGGTYPGTF
ncbi:MAG: SDR family oxidoreductase [Giesbergeria sp.]|uniref:SDR family oxidoreductase n=1 Tax=Giesbergeria sp. TaxID=2818473 RepID=UPI0026268B1F|nr:SDR family oxidoreductase [Giesbergeria sp.]MDD2609298.1 SDR family oxidoreductase [Giesbergeria sp.]